jgi:hypothetical protein
MSNSRFKKAVRIDPKQLAWLKRNKDCKTVAGFLDKLINFYKKYGHSKKFLARCQFEQLAGNLSNLQQKADLQENRESKGRV